MMNGEGPQLGAGRGMMIASGCFSQIPLSTGHWASEALRPTQRLVKDSRVGRRQEGTSLPPRRWDLKVPQKHFFPSLLAK